MTSRSSRAVFALLLAACTPDAEQSTTKGLPTPEDVRKVGKAMLTTQGYIHPEDPPGTRRSTRPHGLYIAPCSAWVRGEGLTDAYGKTTSGPQMISLSWTVRDKPGMESVTATAMTAAYGPPHPPTKSVVIGQAAPLGAHWTWTLASEPGATLIAEALPDGRVRYHFAKLGHVGTGGGTSASFRADCIIEDLGTPGW